MTDSRYASRKFILAVVALLGASVALYLRLIGAEEYKVMVLGALTLYNAGNVVQKMATKNE